MLRPVINDDTPAFALHNARPMEMMSATFSVDWLFPAKFSSASVSSFSEFAGSRSEKLAICRSIVRGSANSP